MRVTCKYYKYIYKDCHFNINLYPIHAHELDVEYFYMKQKKKKKKLSQKTRAHYDRVNMSNFHHYQLLEYIGFENRYNITYTYIYSYSHINKGFFY